MRILVFGAGAVGSTIGGMLARKDNEVVLVGRDPHMSRISLDGLKISGLWGSHHVQKLRAVSSIPTDFEPELIILTTKAHATESAAKLLAQHFPTTIPIFHLQNGVGNAETLAKVFGWERIISGMIIIGFSIPLAGRAVVTVQADKVKVGRVGGALDDWPDRIASLLRDADIPAESVDGIATHLWGKVLYNASLNPLGAILRTTYGALLDAEPWSIIEQVVREAFAVLKAEKQFMFWKNAAEYLEHLRTIQIPATFDHKPSMAADLNHARRTEIDAINGAIATLGRRHRIDTPVNDTLIALIHTLEKGEPLPFKSVS